MSKDAYRRIVEEPSTRLTDALSVLVIIVVFVALTLTVGVLYENYAASTNSDAASPRTSASLPTAGSASMASQMAGNGSGSAPTGAAFIYLIGGMAP